MKKLFILIAVIIAFTSCKRKNVWNKDYESKTYDTIYTSLGSIMKDSTQRKEFSQFIVAKLKAKLPFGIESIPDDSLNKLSAKIAAEYETSHKSQDFQAVLPWSKQTEFALRNSIEKRLGNKFTGKQKEKYCDCMIAQLKLIYPDSLVTPLTDSTTTIVTDACISTLVKQ